MTSFDGDEGEAEDGDEEEVVNEDSSEAFDCFEGARL